MLVGSGVDAYQAGSIWHLFDTQVYLPLTRTKISAINRVDFSSYSHIILPSGNYNNKLNDKITESLNLWVKNGGTLIGLQKGAKWIEEKIQKPDASKKENAKKDKTKKDKSDPEKTTEYKAYADYDKDKAKKILGGAIIAANADLSHPLAFGMNQKQQYVLMKGTTVLTPSDNPYGSPLKITKQVRAAGYVSDHWQEKLSEAPLVIAERSGKGLIIKFGFNPNFRAFWLGTQKWLINAIYQSQLVKKTDMPD
ncbi:MAG: hypothetical protein L3J52_09880, partial [Proteobacteria bacterium]|nr:hypothetical protein [Pseudomonadota bacterium]